MDNLGPRLPRCLVFEGDSRCIVAILVVGGESANSPRCRTRVKSLALPSVLGADRFTLKRYDHAMSQAKHDADCYMKQA